MNRKELVRLALVHQAYASAARALLEADAEHEWVFNESRASWTTPDGATVAANISGRTLVVQDDQQFLAWLREQHPSEVVEVLRPRNTEWVKQQRDAWAAEVAAGQMDAPPGTKLDEGGAYLSVSVTGVTALKKRLETLAAGVLGSGTQVTPDELLEMAKLAELQS